MAERNVVYLDLPRTNIKLNCYGSLKKEDIAQLKRMIKNSKPTVKIATKPKLNTIYCQIHVRKIKCKPIVFSLRRNDKVVHISRENRKSPNIFHSIKELCL